MKKVWVLTLAATIVLAAVPASAGTPPGVITGTVFLDANANGRRDAGETGIAGVRVTDGVGFAVTGPEGAYTLTVQPDLMLPFPGTQAVAVCWPSGMWPTGKHWSRIKDMPAPGRMDFGLRKMPGQSLPFYYLHVTDSHDWRASRYTHQHEMVNKVLKDATFIIHTGDMSLGGRDEAGVRASGKGFRYNQGKCAMPTFTAIGNHDTDSGVTGEYKFCGGFVSQIGPLRFSFDYAGVHFVFVDVIASKKEWNDFSAAWLEKDFASLKPGTRIVLSYHYPDPADSRRFVDVLRKHKVELVHAGHNHAYGRWRRWVVPMVTAFARSSGTAGINVVDRDGIHIAVYCDGCARGSHNFRHSRRCPTRWRTHFLEGALQGRHGRSQKIANTEIDGTGRSMDISTKAVYVSGTFDPGAAKSIGMRIAATPKPFDVVYTGRHIEIDGVAAPFLLPDHEKALRLYVFAHKDMISVYANDCFFMEKPRPLDRVGRVRPVAAGGKATVVSMTVQEIKPDPGNRATSYGCSCGHGGILRNPE